MSTKEREEAMNEYGFNTGLLHGTNEKYPQGATQVPIYQSSAFRHDSAEDLEKFLTIKNGLLLYKDQQSYGRVL